MELKGELCKLSARIPERLADIQTEEATKSVLVLPFLAALGYTVSAPAEITTGLRAGVGSQKVDAVDYVILRAGRPVLLIECIHHATDLASAEPTRLQRNFGAAETRLGLFTNGVMYWFYADLDVPKRMDAKPFLAFNLLDVRDEAVEELKMFAKAAFDVDTILTSARALEYTRAIQRVLHEQFQEPSDEFLKLITAQVYAGRMTQAVKEQFAQLTRQAFVQLVNDQLNERLKAALRQPLRSRTL